MQTNSTKLSVILLDRDGVINREPGPILYPEDFVMIPRSADAIARINDNGLLCFIVTNQAAFARGDLNVALDKSPSLLPALDPANILTV